MQQLFLRQQEALLRENGGTAQIQMALHQQAFQERQVLEQQKMMMQQQLVAAQTQLVQQNLMAQQLMMQSNNLQMPNPPVVPSPVVSPNPGRKALNINFAQMSLNTPLTGHNNVNVATQQNFVQGGNGGFANFTQSGIADLDKVVNLGQNIEPVVSLSPVDQATQGGQNLGQSEQVQTELLKDLGDSLEDDNNSLKDYDVTLKGSNVVSTTMNDVESLGDSIWQEALKDSTHHSSTERLKGEPRHGGRTKRGVERTLSNSLNNMSIGNHMSIGSTSFANMNLSDMELSTDGMSRDQKMNAARSLASHSSTGMMSRDQKMSAARSMASNSSMMSELTDYEDI